MLTFVNTIPNLIKEAINSYYKPEPKTIYSNLSAGLGAVYHAALAAQPEFLEEYGISPEVAFATEVAMAGTALAYNYKNIIEAHKQLAHILDETIFGPRSTTEEELLEAEVIHFGSPVADPILEALAADIRAAEDAESYVFMDLETAKAELKALEESQKQRQQQSALLDNPLPVQIHRAPQDINKPFDGLNEVHSIKAKLK